MLLLALHLNRNCTGIQRCCCCFPILLTTSPPPPPPPKPQRNISIAEVLCLFKRTSPPPPPPTKPQRHISIAEVLGAVRLLKRTFRDTFHLVFYNTFITQINFVLVKTTPDTIFYCLSQKSMDPHHSNSELIVQSS